MAQKDVLAFLLHLSWVHLEIHEISDVNELLEWILLDFLGASDLGSDALSVGGPSFFGHLGVFRHIGWIFSFRCSNGFSWRFHDSD